MWRCLGQHQEGKDILKIYKRNFALVCGNLFMPTCLKCSVSSKKGNVTSLLDLPGQSPARSGCSAEFHRSPQSRSARRNCLRKVTSASLGEREGRKWGSFDKFTPQVWCSVLLFTNGDTQQASSFEQSTEKGVGRDSYCTQTFPRHTTNVVWDVHNFSWLWDLHKSAVVDWPIYNPDHFLCLFYLLLYHNFLTYLWQQVDQRSFHFHLLGFCPVKVDGRAQRGIFLGYYQPE